MNSLENFPKEFIELYQENKQLIQATLIKEAVVSNSSISESSHLSGGNYIRSSNKEPENSNEIIKEEKGIPNIYMLYLSRKRTNTEKKTNQ